LDAIMSWELDRVAAARALQRVLAAFGGEPFPPDTAVSEGGCWFDESGKPHVYVNPEAEEVARFFGARPWSEIAPEALLAWKHASVSATFLSPRARAHYLPAFLRAFLTRPLDGIAVDVIVNAVHMWTPPNAISPQIWHTRTERQKSAMKDAEAQGFQAFTDALTEAQKAAVATALAVLAPPFDDPDLENPVRTALDAFWGAYLPPGF
jgi:hypothetical protein